MWRNGDITMVGPQSYLPKCNTGKTSVDYPIWRENITPSTMICHKTVLKLNIFIKQSVALMGHTWRGAVGVTGSWWTGSAFFVKGLTLTMLLLCYTVQLTFTNTCPNINICQNINIWWDSEVILAPFCFLWKHLVLINSHFISLNGNFPSKSYAPENKQTNKNYLRQ